MKQEGGDTTKERPDETDHDPQPRDNQRDRLYGSRKVSQDLGRSAVRDLTEAIPKP